MAATGILQASLDLQPTLDATGQPTGLDYNQPVSSASYSLTITKWQQYHVILTAPSSSLVLAVSNFAAINLIAITANKVVYFPTLIQTAVTQRFLAQNMLFITTAAGSPITAITVQDLGSGGTVADIIVGGT